MLIHGRCHCGNIAFTLRWEPEPARIPARACSCSFCVKHGGVWTSCPTGSLQVQVQRPEAVHRYAFGTRTATFHICSECGVVPVVTSEIGGRTYAVVSVHAFEDVDPALLQPGPVSFDGEEVGDRLARRARNWIPDVRFAVG
ncbi:GFA family protein [Ramlibacter sp. AN1133]|uniref:GFA family protein n=1 Tax=Ramlibacter sp. AN1133 TaxID=3133429 RepID=UPI0030BC3F4B